MSRPNESGSHLIGLALGLVALGVIGFAGYRVWTMQQTGATTSTPASTATTAAASVPKAITNNAALNQAASALDQAASQVNSNLDDSSLNADLNALM